MNQPQSKARKQCTTFVMRSKPVLLTSSALQFAISLGLAFAMKPASICLGQVEPSAAKTTQKLLYSDDRTRIFGAEESPDRTNTQVVFGNKTLENVAAMTMRGEGVEVHELEMTYWHNVMDSVGVSMSMCGRTKKRLGMMLFIDQVSKSRIQHDFNIDGVWDYAVDRMKSDQGRELRCFIWHDGQWKACEGNAIPIDDEPKEISNGVAYVFRGDGWKPTQQQR
jgi:hypothetical protein